MIKIEHLQVRLSDFHLKDINLSIKKGEFFALMEPTGAGKTLLLEAIAGLIPVKGGDIFIGRHNITHLPPEKRGISIVYQDQALFPHLTVLENIKYGLHFHKIDPQKAQKRQNELVAELNIEHLKNRLPLNLSGGELQRVALARALRWKVTCQSGEEKVVSLSSKYLFKVCIVYPGLLHITLSRVSRNPKSSSAEPDVLA